MLQDAEEMERNGELACGKADNRSIDLPKIRAPAFSPKNAKTPKN